jgi:hypothetical protein
MKDDRRCVKIRLTQKGDKMFRDTYAAHIAFIKPFFERALSRKDVDVACALLIRLRDSFREEAGAYAKLKRMKSRIRPDSTVTSSQT